MTSYIDFQREFFLISRNKNMTYHQLPWNLWMNLYLHARSRILVNESLETQLQLETRIIEYEIPYCLRMILFSVPSCLSQIPKSMWMDFVQPAIAILLVTFCYVKYRLFNTNLPVNIWEIIVTIPIIGKNGYTLYDQDKNEHLTHVGKMKIGTELKQVAQKHTSSNKKSISALISFHSMSLIE